MPPKKQQKKSVLDNFIKKSKSKAKPIESDSEDELVYDMDKTNIEKDKLEIKEVNESRLQPEKEVSKPAEIVSSVKDVNPSLEEIRKLILSDKLDKEESKKKKLEREQSREQRRLQREQQRDEREKKLVREIAILIETEKNKQKETFKSQLNSELGSLRNRFNY